MAWGMRLLSAMISALLLSACASSASSASTEASTPTAQHRSGACAAHPAWHRFARDFISADGRVIDASTPALMTTSEGQSYGLFFALVNTDRARFDQLLAWTQNNLAAGDLRARLPAWSWGRADDGQWRVLDGNAASDSDVWIAYSLLAAAEQWSSPAYRALGLALAARIIASETVELDGLGRVLLPGPTGFHPDATSWRLNPSYWPISVLRGMAAWTASDDWQALVFSSEKLLRQSAPRAVAPDWFVLNSETGAIHWPAEASDSAYNAIRVYLWLGMMPFDDPLSASLRSHFAPWASRVLASGAVPERIEATTAKVLSEHHPIGFAQAALPFLQAQAEVSERAGLAAISARAGQPREGYYTEVLTLFSEFWRDGLFHFTRDGRLQIAAGCR